MLDIDLMEEIGYYQKKPQKKGLDQKIVIALVLVVVVAACVLFSPLFSVKKIEVEGASQFTTSGIICFCSAKAERKKRLRKVRISLLRSFPPSCPIP